MSALWEAIKEATKDGKYAVEDMASKLGTKYLALAKSNPELLSYATPPVTAREWLARHGMDASTDTNVSTPFNPRQAALYFSHPDRPFPNGGSADIYPAKYWAESTHEFGYPATAAPLFNMGDKPVAVFHTSNLLQGSGAGSNLYPAMYDYTQLLQSKPINASDQVLTDINTWRKPWSNVVPSMIRHNDTLSLPHEDSLAHLSPTYLADSFPAKLVITPDEFYHYDLPTQIGINQMAGGLGAMRNMRTNIDALRRMASKVPMDNQLSEDSRIPAIRSLATFSPDKPDFGMGVTADSPLSAFKDLATTLQNAGVRSTGDASLRRLQVLDALSQDQALSNPSILQNLEKRTGGLVHTT